MIISFDPNAKSENYNIEVVQNKDPNHQDAIIQPLNPKPSLTNAQIANIAIECLIDKNFI